MEDGSVSEAAFRKIAAGLEDVIAFSNGDNSRVANPFAARLEMVKGAAATAWQVADKQTLNALADCERTLRRIAKRATVTEGFERFEIRQINGPAIEFTGRLLCETSFADRREGNQVTLEVYETQGGAMVAVRAFERSDGGESEAATVITPAADLQAMRFAVMDAFGWRTEAKAMVRKKLGWELRVEVE
jgi:hypothetical protein